MAIRAKAKLSGDVVGVKMLMKHPMDTGQQVDSKTGEKIPAFFISEVECMWNGEVVFHCNMGPAVSKNPYLAFSLKGPKAGDELTFTSVDNKGNKDSGTTVIR